MVEIKNIIIIGITGQQGGSIAKHFLKTNKYNIIGISRNINSEKSIELKKQGVKMIECNISDYEKLKNIFKQEKINYVYSVTNTDDEEIFPENTMKEIDYGINIVNASYDANVDFLIWSSLPFVKSMDIKAYNNKNIVEQYIRKKNIKAVYLYLGYFMTNFINDFKPILKIDGTISFSIPIVNENTKLPLIDVESDLGKIVFNILENTNKYNQEIIHVASEELKIKQIIEKYEQINKQKAIFEKDLNNNNLYNEYDLYLKLWKDNNYYLVETDLTKVYDIYNNMTKWEDWIKINNFKITN